MSVSNGKTIKHLHPITYISGQFQGNQINWAALNKEAYAIYMAVKKLSFYLLDNIIRPGRDNLPLKGFFGTEQ